MDYEKEINDLKQECLKLRALLGVTAMTVIMAMVPVIIIGGKVEGWW